MIGACTPSERFGNVPETTPGHHDLLGDEPPVRGQVIFNYGDPAFKRYRRADDPPDLPREEALFLRIIAYLAFAESVCVPARYVLQDDAIFRAVKLGEPLLRAGLLRIERRTDEASFDELARTLKLQGRALHRAQYLDSTVESPRPVRWRALSDRYRVDLRSDLARGGHFRRALLERIGPQKRPSNLDELLDQAHDAYIANSDETPDAFFNTIGQFAPAPVTKLAHRWAMARYYITPTQFDSLNTREIPRAAADLLIAGELLTDALRPLEVPAPAEKMFGELKTDVPLHDATLRAPVYCEAIREVRRKFPYAREVFKDVRARAELGVMSDELNGLMRAELDRQLGLKRRSGLGFAVATSLLGGGIGEAVGDDPFITIGTGIATGVATYSAERARAARREAEDKPWALAIDFVRKEVRTR